MDRLLSLFARRSPGAVGGAIAPVFCALVLNGCGGSGEGLDQNGRPLGEGGDSAALTTDFQSIQDRVLTPICAQCHVGAAAPLGFRLDAGSAYAMLVNAPSVEVPTLMRVNPGHPDSSYMIQKIQGTAAVGEQMPLHQTPLPQATIDIIRQWVANGAQPAAQSANAAAGRLTPHSATFVRPIAPIEGEVLTPASGEIVFTADGELDAASLNSASVVVTRSLVPGNATEGRFDEGAVTVVPDARLQIRTLSPTTFAVILPSAARIPGLYRITLHASGSAPIVDRAGAPIAPTPGTGAAPSASGDLVLQFSIEDLP